MRLTDTHCHLDLDQFDADRDEVIQRAAKAGVSRILIPALTLDSSLAAVKLAAAHPMLFAAIGVHPNDAQTWNESATDELRALASRSDKVVSIGEIGLDYYWDSAAHNLQQRILREQLALAAELNLPVVIHLREKDNAGQGPASSDLMEILEEWMAGLRSRNEALAERPGVLHSFSGSGELARQPSTLIFTWALQGRSPSKMPVTGGNWSHRFRSNGF